MPQLATGRASSNMSAARFSGHKDERSTTFARAAGPADGQTPSVDQGKLWLISHREERSALKDSLR
jgi:hypothetical protein